MNDSTHSLAAISPDLLARMRRLAAKLTGRGDEGDLFEAGLLGLAQAVQRWDEEKMEGDFEAYAITSARNAMKQELRDRDLLTRGQRREVREAEKATHRLTSALGRVPRASEIARDLGLSFDAYRAIIEAGGVVDVDLHEIAADTPFASLAPGAMHTEACVDLLHRIQRMREEVVLLPPRLAEVLRLYYDEGLLQREIGARLRVSEVRAGQLLREAVEELRRRITRTNAAGNLTLRPSR